MKKIILLIAFIITPLFGYSQTWDFNNTADGWTPNNSNSVATPDATFLNVQFNSGNNPRLQQDVTNLATSSNQVIAITLRNNSATGPGHIRFRYAKAGSGFVTNAINISKGDSDFKTYYFSISDAEWTNPYSGELRIEFKDTDNTTYTGDGSSLDLDIIEFVATIPTTEKNSYTFDTTNDGWSANTRMDQNVGAGDLELTLTSTSAQFGKVTLVGFHVNASTNKNLHVRIKNTSTNDELTFLFPGQTATYIKTLSTQDTDYATYDFDLSADAGWTGNVNGLAFKFDKFDVAANVDNVNPILIDEVIFNSTSLSVGIDEITNLTLYPNPFNDRLSIKSDSNLASIEIYNLLGQKVFEQKSQLNEEINLSTLNNGTYIIKLFDTRNRISTRKLIVE